MVNTSMNFLDMKKCQKRPRAPKPIFLGLESERYEIWIPNFEISEKSIKDAPKQTVQIGSYTFPNELTRDQHNEKTIWVEIQKHCKNAVIIKIWLFF